MYHDVNANVKVSIKRIYATVVHVYPIWLAVAITDIQKVQNFSKEKQEF